MLAGHPGPRFGRLLLLALAAGLLPAPARAAEPEAAGAPSLFDERARPIALVRTLYVTTFEDRITVSPSGGAAVEIDSARMDPCPFGHREGFVLENVEFGLKGRFASSNTYYQLKMELVPREKDGNRSSDWLKDAYAGWAPLPWLDLRAGRMKVPYSQANLVGTEDQVLVNKPTLDLLSQKRQLGFQAGFSDPWRVASLRGGVFNSVSQAFEQMRSGDQLLYVARLDLRVQNLLAALGAGVDDLEVNLGANVAWTTRNYDPPSEHRWVGADLRLHWWRFTLEGEVLALDYYLEPDPVTGAEEAERGWGWHADLDVALWPAGLSLAARVEQMDGDSLVRGQSSTLSIDELSRQKRLWVTAGLRYALTRNVRVDVNYVHRREQEGYSFDNDVLLGMVQFAL